MYKYDFNASADFVARTPESSLSKFAFEMNRKWPLFANAMQALEMDGLDGVSIDHLMEGIFIVWHATVKCAHLRLPKLTQADLEHNVKLFSSFLEYHRGETDIEDRRSLKYIQHGGLEAFTAMRISEIQGKRERISQVSAIYMALMKCFDDAIAKREEHRSARQQ